MHKRQTYWCSWNVSLAELNSETKKRGDTIAQCYQLPSPKYKEHNEGYISARLHLSNDIQIYVAGGHDDSTVDLAIDIKGRVQ
jgi:hypothetical protein